MCILLPGFLRAQEDSVSANGPDKSFVRIHSIIIEGNNKTKPQVILREITFLSGDTIAFDKLMTKMEVSRNQIQNLNLFNEVVINIKNWTDQDVDIIISVKERWYIFPVPVLNLYDRNFSVWWRDHDHSLKYLQFGIRYQQQNVRGRNENLNISALFGYSQLYEIQYNIPYINRKQNLGLRYAISYSQSKNITYGFADNKDLIFQDFEEFQRKNFYTLAELFYKPAFNYRCIFTLSYNDKHISDTIAKLNPDYFLYGQKHQYYFTAQATFIRDFRDIISYPLRGNYMSLSFSKLGFGSIDNVNIFATIANYDQYVHISKKWYLSSQNKLKVSFPKIQPYNQERGLGYGNDNVSGYEYYVVDGQSYGYTKLNLKNEILKVKVKTPPNNPFLKGARIPFALYGRVYLDAGYVKDDYYFENNPLNNSFLLGGGVGLDIFMVYDTTLKLEYSINKLGEKGFFLHVNSIF